ncbi:MAG: MBL fold metallo-hydrolase [Candidatus Scatomorpha sp.]|jgi:glyoxylase-like metal-dependent hydrolase (beta-lactamase superfamily II)
MITHIGENIYSFQVPLPGNPLKWLNVYVIKGEGHGRNLLIDTGFKRPECLEALLLGMQELELDPNNTDVLLTHLHSDHTGNAPELNKLGSRLLMSRIDNEMLNDDGWPERKERSLREGMPADVMEVVFDNNPATIYAPAPFDAEWLHDGDIISYGGYDLECILTPGHTPGHICLYEKRTKTMFLGDHVLFDITPNIVNWEEMKDALDSYIHSLKKLLNYEVKIALPSHRTTGNLTMEERIEQIIVHHEKRLGETENIIRTTPNLCAYEITGRMKWRIRAKNWEEFPPGQKWFAMGEALSHIDYLIRQGRIMRNVASDGIYTYSAK